MQSHIQKTFGVKCSRASLSRRMREMGFTRGIIRRGFRSSDQSVPPLSQVDIERLIADPSPDDELVGLTGNAKKAKYAWLLDGEPAGTRKPRKKKQSGVEMDESLIQPGLDDGHLGGMDDPDENHMMTSQYPIPVGQHHLSPAQDPYVPSYMSPYRQVTAENGMMIRHAGENPSPLSRMMAGPPQPLVMGGPLG